MSRCRNTRAVLLMNYMLCLNAYPQINNRFKTQIQNKWNGFWILRFAQMLNLGVSNKLISPTFLVPSVTLEKQCPQQKDFSEDIRTELAEVLRANTISINALAVAQTTLGLLNAPVSTALGSASYKYVAPISWYEKGEKITDWAVKTNQFKQSLETGITVFTVPIFKKQVTTGNTQNNAVEAFTELF